MYDQERDGGLAGTMATPLGRYDNLKGEELRAKQADSIRVATVTERVRHLMRDGEMQMSRLQQAHELNHLLEKNPDIARIIDLMQQIGIL